MAEKKRILTALIIVFAPMIYFGLLFTTFGLGPFEDDLIQYFPNMVWLGQQLSDGVFPFWNGLVYGGYPQVGDPQSGILYPINWLSAILPVRVLYPTLLMVCYWIGGFGMYRLGREWGMARGPATFGAVAWMFCGFMLGHRTHYTMLASAGWMSVIFYFWTRVGRAKGSKVFWSLVILAQTMQILAGHIQIAMLTGMAVGLYLLFTMGDRRWRMLFAFGSSYVLTFGLASIQIFPVWHLYADSIRSANSYRFVTENSFFPMAWTLLIAPASMGLRVPNFLYEFKYFGPWNHCELNCFTTFIALSLAGFSVWNFRRDKNNRKLTAFLVCLALVAVFFALGRYNPAFAYLYHLPIVRPFRCPARYLLLFNFAIASLAMIGLQSLSNVELRGRFRKFVMRFVPLIMFLFVGYFVGLAIWIRNVNVAQMLPASLSHLPAAVLEAIAFDNPALLLPMFAGFLIIAVSMFFKAQLSRVLLVVLLLEVGAFAPFYDFRFDKIENVSLNPMAAIELGQARENVDSRADGFIWPLSENPYESPLVTLEPFTNMLVGRASINGYGPLLNKYHRRIFNWELWPTTGNYVGLLGRPDLLGRFDIRYVIADAKMTERIEVLRAFKSSAGESDTAVILNGEETRVIKAGSGFDFERKLADGMYEVNFEVRRLSFDQLRFFVSAGGIVGRLWDDQRLQLTTWDIGEDWRRFKWCFFVPENARDGFSLSLRVDYGECEVRHLTVKGIACSFDHLSLIKRGVDDVAYGLYENNSRVESGVYFAKDVRVINGETFADRRMGSAEAVVFGGEKTHDLGVTWITGKGNLRVPNLLGKAKVTGVQEDTNSLEVNVSVLDNPAVLVVPGGYDEGWLGQVDGVESEVLCADGISRAMIVPVGKHTVVMTYSPVSFQVGSAITAFSALLLLFVVSAGLNSKKDLTSRSGKAVDS